MPLMAGRQAFLEILRAAGVEYIIGNPGTTELPLMDVLPDHPEFKYILTLQEGVAMAMADGYALASGKLGVLNVHVAPGLGHCWATGRALLPHGTPAVGGHGAHGGVHDQVGLPDRARG
jgi:benzoylformate decarboxylase